MPDPKNFVTRAQIAYTPQSFREADDSVEFTLSTEQPALIFDFARFELVNEIIMSDGVIIPDNKQIPLIDSHDRGTVKNILGSVRDFKIEDGKLVPDQVKLIHWKSKYPMRVSDKGFLECFIRPHDSRHPV